MFAAAGNGNVELVRALVEAGANVDQAFSTTYGATPLCVSAKKGHVEVVRALLEAGANVDQAALLEVGADINLNCTHAFGMTHALCAALLGHEEVENLLRRAPSKVCGNPGCRHTARTASMKGEFKKCSGCLGVKYCSQSCQRVHWKEHKKVCNKN